MSALELKLSPPFYFLLEASHNVTNNLKTQNIRELDPGWEKQHCDLYFNWGHVRKKGGTFFYQENCWESHVLIACFFLKELFG